MFDPSVDAHDAFEDRVRSPRVIHAAELPFEGLNGLPIFGPSRVGPISEVVIFVSTSPEFRTVIAKEGAPGVLKSLLVSTSILSVTGSSELTEAGPRIS